MSMGIPCYTIIVNVTFAIKTAQRYFVYLITSKLVVLTSDSLDLETLLIC